MYIWFLFLLTLHDLAMSEGFLRIIFTLKRPLHYSRLRNTEIAQGGLGYYVDFLFVSPLAIGRVGGR